MGTQRNTRLEVVRDLLLEHSRGRQENPRPAILEHDVLDRTLAAGDRESLTDEEFRSERFEEPDLALYIGALQPDVPELEAFRQSSTPCRSA